MFRARRMRAQHDPWDASAQLPGGSVERETECNAMTSELSAAPIITSPSAARSLRLGLTTACALTTAVRPVAFRTTLALGMILAVANAEAVSVFAALKLDPSGLPGPASS